MCQKLATLAEDFAQYRGKRIKVKYPQTLWERALELCNQHPIKKVAKMLGISNVALQRHLNSRKIEGDSSPFIPIQISESSQSIQIHIRGKVQVTIDFYRSTEELAKLVLAIQEGSLC